MSSAAERDLDLVLVGATGYVGRLTARHLAEHAPEGVRIGLAGRSAERLQRVRETLPDAARTWPLITVDVLDAGQVADLAARTRVVASTVGPYLRYGLPLVEACAAAGTHYADLTGETLFVRRSIDAADATARRTGARIVHSCGFDSVPSDLGVGLAGGLADADGTGPVTSAVLQVLTARGGISGGTIDSLRQQVIETQQDDAAAAIAGNPYALTDDPPGAASDRGTTGSATGSAKGRVVGRDPRSGSWQAPFVMGPYNGQIVQRSRALAGQPYGPDFSYREVVATGGGLRGAVGAVAVAGLTGALVAGMVFPPTRRVLDRVLPKPGQGPSERTRATGRFRVQVDATTATGAAYRTTIGADRDPGYDGTAVMVGESALALAAGTDLGPAGVVTPMIAVGATLPQRLRDRGFEVTTERIS